jgi:hypothetical protein
MVIVMLMFFKYLIYVLYMTEDINLMQFLSLMFFCALHFVHLPRTLLVYEYPLGTSETFLCFMLAHIIKIVPPAGVQLRQIQFVFRSQIVTLSQMWCYFTTLLQGVLINYLSIFYLFIRLFWLCLLYLCPVHCPLLFVFVCCAVSVIGHLAVDSAY